MNIVISRTYVACLACGLGFLSCVNKPINLPAKYCQESNMNASGDCKKINFEQLTDSAFNYGSKCITIEGFLSMNFEDVAIYRSNKDRKKLRSEYACWLNFSDSLGARMESIAASLNKKKVTIKGYFTNKRKGHLNAYIGEIDSVFCVELK